MHVAAPPNLSAPDARPYGAWRLLTGLLQGGALYLLYRADLERAWPAPAPLLFAPLFLMALFAPAVLISSLGHLDRRRLLLWTAAVAVVLIGLGCWDGWRVGDLPLLPAHIEDGPERFAGIALHRSAYPSTELVVLIAGGLFVAHALVVAAARDGRRIASYATYFDTAWTLGVQLAFSALFIGVTWLVLFLGTALFELVSLQFLSKLLAEKWFQIPVNAFAFACGMHLTDVRPAIVRGIRGLLLTLMSWLLPVTALLVGGFLAALPFTGMAPLWATRHAASVLMCAAAVLVVLVNAAWQGGDASAARPVRWAARLATLLLAPLVLIAMYALTLRVHDHGWTGDRVHAAAFMLVGACYAAGYFVAGLRPGWLPLLARVNVFTAFAVPAIILALSSPLADPARIAVASQVARLESGRIPAARFDFAYLRFDAERFGRQELDRLERTGAGPDAATVRRLAAATRTMAGAWDKGKLEPPADLSSNLRVHPDGVRLPDAFLHSTWTDVRDHWRLPECLAIRGKHCDAFRLDVDGDGQKEIVLVPDNDGRNGTVFGLDAQGRWQLVATFSVPATGCPRSPVDFATAKIGVLPPRLNDLEIGGARVHLAPETPQVACRSSTNK